MKSIFRKMFLFSFIFLCVLGCRDKRLTKLESFDLLIQLPDNYIEMDEVEFSDYFRGNYYPDSIVEDRLVKIGSLQNISNYIYLQDTSNIYNNIVIMEPPYIVLNKKTFKLLRNELKKSVKNGFPNCQVESVETSLKAGTYNYGKFKYKLSNAVDSFEIIYYVLNKQNRSMMIVVNNTEGLDLEKMIRIIE